MIPKRPLESRKLRTEDGNIPPGSSGWAYVQFFDPLRASDTSHAGRTWPVRYNERDDTWIAIGEGRRMENGEIAETYPLVRVQSEMFAI